MNDCKEGPSQCTGCLKFFRSKLTFSLHFEKCNKEISVDKLDEISENSDVNIGDSVIKDNCKSPQNCEIKEDKSVDELEKEIEKLQEEIDVACTTEQENVDVLVKNESFLMEIKEAEHVVESEKEKEFPSDEGKLDLKINADEGLTNLSMESIEIADSDEEDSRPTNTASASIDLTDGEDPVEIAQIREIVKKTKKFKRKVKAPFKPKPCTYCDEQCHDRIGLAKHMIKDHWETVRRAQGGGKVDRSSYYNQIQDERIIRPQPPKMSARTSFHMKGLAGADAINRIYQKNPPNLQTRNPAWLQKLQSSKQIPISSKQDLMDFSKSQNNMSMQQLANFKKYNQKPNPYLLNKKNRNPHSPAWFGKPPNRKPINLQNPTQVLDLTTDDEPSCDVCEDDFNWPDENHACPLKQNKKLKMLHPNNPTVLKKGGLTALKEKIFQNNKPLPQLIAPKKRHSNTPSEKSLQFDSSIKKIPSSTKLIPISPKQTTASREKPTRTMPTRTLPTRTMSPRTLPTRTMPDRTLPTRTIPTKLLPSRTMPTKTLPARNSTMATRTMPSRRVKTY